jgi:hypothetical protein
MGQEWRKILPTANKFAKLGIYSLFSMMIKKKV